MFNKTSSSGGLFGASSTAQPGTSSLFGTPKPSTTAGGLFGASSTTQPGTSSLFGTPKPSTSTGGLFGASSTAQPGTFSLFGTPKPSTSAGGLFGASSAQPAGSSLFGTPKTSTSTGGLFGASSTSQPGSSLFGTPKPSISAAGVFGSLSTTQQLVDADDKSVQEIIASTNALVTAVNKPVLYGDDSDASIARLNQLLAAVGIGSGYYDKDQPPIIFDCYNPFFQFRGVGYCALSRNKDVDGIVGLILKRSADSLETPQERQKLLDVLFGILGNNPKVHAHIFDIRAITEELCEMEIYVTQSEYGRIPATQIYQHLQQPDKKNALQLQANCENVIPRIGMDDADIKRYLNSPPKGFTEDEWRRAVAKNPDSIHLLPYPIYGYNELVNRRHRQLKEGEVQGKLLEEATNKLKKISLEVERLNGLKKFFKDDVKSLKHRILKVLAVTHANNYQGAMTLEEEKVLSRLETLAVIINAHDKLRYRCEYLQNYLNVNKESLEARKKDAADHTPLNDEESAALKRYLTRRQDDLELITESILKDSETLNIMANQL